MKRPSVRSQQRFTAAELHAGDASRERWPRRWRFYAGSHLPKVKEEVAATRADMGGSGSKSDPTKAEIDASAITDALAALNMGALDANAAERC